MLAEVSSREITEWRAYASWLTEQREGSSGATDPVSKRQARIADLMPDDAQGEVPGSRAPGEPPPDKGIGGIDIPPAALWEG